MKNMLYIITVIAGIVVWNMGYIPIEDLLICLALVPVLTVGMLVVEKLAETVSVPFMWLFATPAERKAARAVQRLADRAGR